MSPTVLTPAHATGPGSGATMQRELAVRVGYPRLHRLVDEGAGRRDRPLVRRRLAVLVDESPDGGRPVLTLDTVYLQRLQRAAAGHLEAEFLQTVVLLKEIDATTARAAAALSDAESALARLEAAAPGPAEVASDGGDVVGARLERARAGARDAVLAARAELDRLHLERTAQWAALQRRGAQVLAHFDLRAATYADAATRRVRALVAPVRVVRPLWLARVRPPEPGQVTAADGELG